MVSLYCKYLPTSLETKRRPHSNSFYTQILEFGRTEDDQSILDVVGTEMLMIETRLDNLEKIVKGAGNIELLPFINELLKEIDRHKSLTHSTPKPRRSQRLRKN